ncbi:MAG TPA: hypothetical protein VFQ54_10545 [Thermomicrobiales bacterium]|nr:hypothetical protein [Thermomicrobiales bacterium]
MRLKEFPELVRSVANEIKNVDKDVQFLAPSPQPVYERRDACFATAAFHNRTFVPKVNPECAVPPILDHDIHFGWRRNTK